MGWHLGQMACFDIESTGLDIETVRIVTACVAVVDGSGGHEPYVRTWLLDPGVEIPKAASDIHGITTEQARAEGTDPREGIAEIVDLLTQAVERGVPIVGHNVGGYDLSLLDREARRHGIQPLQTVRPVIDTLCLDRHVDKWRKGKRTLEAACEHYKVRIDGAHDASHDALASARIAWRIAQRYPRIAELALDELHALQVAAKKEQDASLADHFRRQGKQVDGLTGHWPIVPFQRQEASF